MVIGICCIKKQDTIAGIQLQRAACPRLPRVAQAMELRLCEQQNTRAVRFATCGKQQPADCSSGSRC